MTGKELYPLHQLKTMNENLYSHYVKKYQNHPRRAKLLDRKIPRLNVLWNDVVHFLPPHPSKVYEALTSVGAAAPKDLYFYKIPIENLKANQNVIYTYDQTLYQGPDAEIHREMIQPLDIQTYQELDRIPPETVEYFKEEHQKGNKFGMFHFIPHVLSHGIVSISNAEKVNWSH